MRGERLPLAAGPVAALPREGMALDPLTIVKLWENPCWFSFRINYLSNHFNVPVYGYIERRYGLLRPEFVVLFSTGLNEGVAATSIVASSGFPKNTISRAIQKLLRRKIVKRAADADDGRRFHLRLTKLGRQIFDEMMPLMCAREDTMLAALSPAEQKTLSNLLAKMVMHSPAWQIDIQEEG
ncbi:MAG: winged helix-turn-helix transcriptional regulator [Beijerinckiaceae bacterium]|nr:winged helix-turn-helix transcriptional regulator [Beijerinckiaceae bacterium]